MTIRTDYDSGRLTVYLSGELDHHQARAAMQSIEELLEEWMPRECVLELSGLSFMDSSGVALMIRLSRRMKEAGGRALLERPQGQPKRVIEAAGVERLLPVAVSR